MITPYYQDDLVTLYCGSALDFPAKWEGVAEVLITDPPYGTANMTGKGRGGYGRKGFHIQGDDDTAVRDAVLKRWFKPCNCGNEADESWCDCPPSGWPALVFGSPRMPDPPGPWRDRLVWDKKRPGMNGGPWRYTHESIYVTDGWVRVDNSHTSIITSYPAPSEHLHRKPVPLMEALIECAPPGVIADPFAGSGSTLIAARNLGRQVIGVELEQGFCEMIVRRLHETPATLQFEDTAW